MKSVLNYPHIGIFILAWFIADLLFPVLIKLSHRLKILDRPGGHKGQSRPVPFLGGIGIFVAFTISVCSTLRFASPQSLFPLLGLLGGGGVVLILGLVDDFRPISAVIKLTVLFLTTLVLASFGICLQLFPDTLFNIPNILATLLWIVGVTSATNSLDNTDGVVGGVTGIACMFMLVIAWGTSAADAQPCMSYLAVALAGSCFGYLRYNFAPARIYLGDNGAFLLGFLLATLMVFAGYSTDPVKVLIIPCLVLSVPLYDIVLATVLRIRDGEVKSIRSAVLYCGRDHLAHLLMEMGLSTRQAAFGLYFLGILGGIAALLVMAASEPIIYLAITLLYLGFLLAMGFILASVRREARARRRDIVDAALLPPGVQPKAPLATREPSDPAPGRIAHGPSRTARTTPGLDPRQN